MLSKVEVRAESSCIAGEGARSPGHWSLTLGLSDDWGNGPGEGQTLLNPD